MGADSDATINRVLRQFGLVSPVIEASPRDHQGFSRVQVWRVRAGEERFALRRYPESTTDPQRLAAVHRLMRYARRAIDFVPWPRSLEDGSTVVSEASSCWTLETWSYGEPLAEVERIDVEVAVTALWMLHEVTHDCQCFGAFEEIAPSVALQKRVAVLREGVSRSRGGSAIPPLRRLEVLLPPAIERILPLCENAASLGLRQQPILGDLRRRDVLYSEHQVTGIVDFGAATVDSPLVDLTRLLGELAGNDEPLWRAGLAAYQLHRKLGEDELAALPALHAGGVVGAACNWLRWISQGSVELNDVVVERLEELVARLEPISEGNLVAQRALSGGDA